MVILSTDRQVPWSSTLKEQQLMSLRTAGCVSSSHNLPELGLSQAAVGQMSSGMFMVDVISFLHQLT